MTSERKIAANRNNAKKSTGPRSNAGREASRRNALQARLQYSSPLALSCGVLWQNEPNLGLVFGTSDDTTEFGRTNPTLPSPGQGRWKPRRNRIDRRLGCL